MEEVALVVPLRQFYEVALALDNSDYFNERPVLSFPPFMFRKIEN